jgi:hypothetical protein
MLLFLWFHLKLLKSISITIDKFKNPNKTIDGFLKGVVKTCAVYSNKLPKTWHDFSYQSLYRKK